MLMAIIICLLLSKTTAQFDGEFWWLNNKLDKYRTDPIQPKFEDLSEFDTDESSKILFKDDDYVSKDVKAEDLNVYEAPKISTSDKKKLAVQFQDISEIAYPENLGTEKTTTNKINVTTEKANQIIYKPSNAKIENDNNRKITSSNDIFEFKFPDDDAFLWKNTIKITNKSTEKTPSSDNQNNTVTVDSGKIHFISNRIPLKVQKDVISETENICTFVKKSECVRLGGTVYYKHESESRRPAFDNRFICCILPVRPPFISSKIYFLDDDKPFRRQKRSEADDRTSSALKQRNTLILRKFGHTLDKVSPITQRPANKVVTPSDESPDPYWNIKNVNFQAVNRQPHSIRHTTSKYDYYGSDDYVEDYVVEIPSPGLVGLYSDHGASKPAWSYGNTDSSEEEGPGYGFSPTVDPRLEDRLATTKFRITGRPVKFNSESHDRVYNVETQTVSYQSNPDFHVLQGYKLLNLVRNKSRVFRNNRRTTTERDFDDQSKESSGEHVLTAASFESDYDGDSKQPIRSECGKVAKGVNRNYDSDSQTGETQKGSHPSLALVVLTKKLQNILCYATIIHARAAVTAADCVYGRTAPGEITVIAGAWRLDDGSTEDWQKRMASTHIHSLYKPGDLGNNLALLYWTRPLRFTNNVQPACLSDAHVGDHCKFYGWGGYDQAVKKQPKWQRAIVLAPATCRERIQDRLVPSVAFCASVQSRGTVTGLGGPLICDVGRRQSAMGVAIWRDHVVVLLPVEQWTLQALADLQLD